MKSMLTAVLATIAVVVCVRRWKPFRVAVSGGSMAPTLADGDACVVIALARGPHIGDVVVARHPLYPGRELVKRVTRDAWPAGWWLEGDTPDGSLDSRELGPFEEGSIAGRIVAVYAPLRRASLCRRG